MATDAFLNFYKCPHCTHEWMNLWNATCDDTCPSCGQRNVSPSTSVDPHQATPNEYSRAQLQQAFMAGYHDALDFLSSYGPDEAWDEWFRRKHGDDQ